MIGQFFNAIPLVLAGAAIGVMAMAVLHHHSGVPAWKATAMKWLVDDAEDLQLHVWQERERPSR